jgi:hypothetical protein
MTTPLVLFTGYYAVVLVFHLLALPEQMEAFYFLILLIFLMVMIAGRIVKHLIKESLRHS